MTSSPVDLGKLIEDFSQLEQKMSDLKATNSLLGMGLNETLRLTRLNQTKEKYLREVENKKLKGSICDLERKNIAKLQDSTACMERWSVDMAAQTADYQREMVEFQGQLQSKLEAKELEMEEAVQRKESELEQMRKRMKEQEREKQTEIIKLQMEFSAKLARAQSISVKAQPQPVGSCPLPQNIYKRKLQFFQEERQKEVDALRQRVKELEQQNSSSFSDSRLKRRRH